MKIDELDEFQGLTVDMVREWLEIHGWEVRECGNGSTDAKKRFTDRVSVLGCDWDSCLGWLLTRVAAAERMSVQTLLREINPRMRNGIPSAAAIAAHEVSGGNWLAQSAQKGGVLRVLNWSVSDDRAKLNTLDTSQKIPRDMVPDSWCFWSCDEHGNKVRWPTDAEGKML